MTTLDYQDVLEEELPSAIAEEAQAIIDKIDYEEDIIFVICKSAETYFFALKEPKGAEGFWYSSVVSFGMKKVDLSAEMLVRKLRYIKGEE